jgi:hypothetical protein
MESFTIPGPSAAYFSTVALQKSTGNCGCQIQIISLALPATTGSIRAILLAELSTGNWALQSLYSPYLGTDSPHIRMRHSGIQTIVGRNASYGSSYQIGDIQKRYNFQVYGRFAGGGMAGSEIQLFGEPVICGNPAAV